MSDMRWLFLWVIAALLVPNAALDITETAAPLWKAANILLPAGIYTLIMAANRRTGLLTLFTLPLMILGAFQIVLLYLYGESIIAVDMFLNVVTTNVAEATELLANLLLAILTVVALYLPPLVWGACAVVSHHDAGTGFRRKARKAGIMLAAAGAAAAVTAIATTGRQFHREIFPINVICNMAEAVNRTCQTANYPETSAGFTYEASSTRATDTKETYVFVIGETARGENWQLGGYGRPTNPRLSRENNVVFFPRAITESNTTHKSVPMMMSFASAENFDSIRHSKSIITAMKEAGFHTCFFSNQAPNRSFTEYFGNEADDVRYTGIATDGTHPYDTDLLPMLAEAIADTTHTRQFIVLHTYGSHFLYRDRYPHEAAAFLPDDAIDANAGHRQDLVNAYDNTILYTDAFLAEAIGTLRRYGHPSALLYSADHGEDIFDDKRERFLHASPTPTYHQLHVGMLMWVSEQLAAQHPEFMCNMRANSAHVVSPQKAMFNTALELAGVTTPKFNATQSLANSSYRYGDPVYLTDLNIAVPLMESGVKASDKENLKKLLTP